ncbi:AlpA family phage regulatory protein [Lichenihabitans sp. Uapishka_5]|uniref:helix-turn-helix transcriptional regulator n=1 Tax=Lichenihabitans sp. Uapishka_5 TaxID=3037302 RepID=UPI0029E7F182|nr:AlpA family phage regulatory protein [Lichenihabitans sp. Uapishka_5]MDX7950495.1 AlpA family phage regulatory protein [Lichenihabitans sp. Uapishka_5]
MAYRSNSNAPTPVVLPPSLERNRLLNVKQMAELTGFSVAHIRRLYRSGKFPTPIRIGGRAVAWPAHVAAKLVGVIEEAA